MSRFIIIRPFRPLHPRENSKSGKGRRFFPQKKNQFAKELEATGKGYAVGV